MKKQIKFGLIGFFMGILLSACEGKSPSANYRVIPLPNSIITEKGRPFVLNSNTKIVYPADNTDLHRVANFLSEYISDDTGYPLTVVSDKEAKPQSFISLSLTDAVSDPEGYQISVSQNGIKIQSNSPSGIFYGTQTLRKSLPKLTGGETAVFNPVLIDDAPRFAYRGTHLDVGRHFFPVPVIKHFIDIMALHNENYFHWHLTDDQGWRIEIKKYPKLTTVGSHRAQTVIKKNTGEYDGIPYDGFYTQEEIKDVVAYAADRFITIIPEIDLPGHMTAALAAYPEFGCTGGPYEVATRWGVFKDVICAGNEKAMTFLEDVLNEVMDLFPSEYIHIGGDECPKDNWVTCPKCQQRIRQNKLYVNNGHTPENNLQSYVVQRMEKVINARGRKMIGWDEILEGGLAPNAIVMSWRGIKGGIEAAQQHHDVIMTPTSNLYFDYYQNQDIEKEPFAIGGFVDVKKVYDYEPIPTELKADEQKYILGCQANVWTEYIPTEENLQYMLLPRLAALSEVQWCQPDRKNFTDFVQRIPQLLNVYDLKGYNYAKHILTLVEAQKNPNTGSKTETK